jgi:uncharacterized RDD family membrane protein YckC
VAVPTVILTFALHLVHIMHSYNADGETTTQLSFSSSVFVIDVLVFVVYYMGLLARRGKHNGQTLGKQATGIRIVRNRGVPVSYDLAAFREGLAKGAVFELIFYAGSSSALAIIPSVVGLYWLLDSLWPLWDHENRALHDMLSGTHVVKVQGVSVWPQAQSPLVSSAPISSYDPPAASICSPSSAPTLAQMQLQEVGYLPVSALVLDADRGCWIEGGVSPRALADAEHVVCVQRLPQGFAVTLPSAYAAAVRTSALAGEAYRASSYHPAASVAFA